ncbi:MAG: FliA/WhiG family RNA polymerase sigma factor [Planctomycetota bacterium]|nr:MAG: FliA/WhiG family RNA polymerase sigma factor [Planctomycetota bacterium]
MNFAAARAYQQSASAEDERVLQYLPLVQHVIGRLNASLPTGLDREDLFSAGVCGLIQAARSYDPSKGASFKTHAYTRIRGEILDELRRADALPRRKRQRLHELQRTFDEQCAARGRPPTLDELAEAMDVSAESLDELLCLAKSASLVSLDSAIEPEGFSLAETIRDPEERSPLAAASLSERQEALAEALAALPPREREVLGLYYMEGLLLREIGKLLGVSESRVCQLHTRALYMLRQQLSTHRHREEAA